MPASARDRRAAAYGNEAGAGGHGHDESASSAASQQGGSAGPAIRGGRAVSRDGTAIAYDRIGQGPAVILVDGALCYRAFGPSADLAQALADRFAVYTYDRRGRGDSGNTPSYAVEREVEDLEAILRAAGGEASVFGVSSGAVLALEAAQRLPGIRKLVLYEAPLIVDDSKPSNDALWKAIDEAVAADRRGEAVKLFLRAVGVPAPVVAIMRITPVWRKLRAVAHTLPHDGALVGARQRGQPLPSGSWSSVRVPVLVMDGGKSPAWMRNGNHALAGVLSLAEYRTLPGQTHMAQAAALAPQIIEFFTRARATS